MNTRFILAIVVVGSCISVMMYSAVRETKKAVVTVNELAATAIDRERIRLGARVSDADIQVASQPQRHVRFRVQDPGVEDGAIIPVVYFGALPDTLQDGRDVILEGSFSNSEFVASSLMTQCPSKYEPPVPADESAASAADTTTLPSSNANY